MSAQVDTPSTLAARSRDENFPVASLLLPRATRERLLAVYAFARLTDQIGDEWDGDRLARLDWVESELTAAAAGTATHPVFVQLEPVLARLDCGPGPFRDLIEANRVDRAVLPAIIVHSSAGPGRRVSSAASWMRRRGDAE